MVFRGHVRDLAAHLGDKTLTKGHVQPRPLAGTQLNALHLAVRCAAQEPAHASADMCGLLTFCVAMILLTTCDRGPRLPRFQALAGHEDVVSYLVESGALPVDSGPFTPLMAVMTRRCTLSAHSARGLLGFMEGQGVTRLCYAHACGRQPSACSGEAIHEDCCWPLVGMAQLLIELGADATAVHPSRGCLLRNRSVSGRDRAAGVAHARCAKSGSMPRHALPCRAGADRRHGQLHAGWRPQVPGQHDSLSAKQLCSARRPAAVPAAHQHVGGSCR